MDTIAVVDNGYKGHKTAFNRYFVKSLLELNKKVVLFFPKPELVYDWVKIHLNSELQNLDVVTYNDLTINKLLFPGYSNAIISLLKWRNLKKYLSSYEKENNVKFDLVFLSWLDDMLANYLHPSILNLFFPYKWSGLYFHPWHIRKESFKIDKKPSFSDVDIALTSSNCINVAIHDEGIIEKFGKRLNKKIIHFPEIADNTPPEEGNKIAEEIKEKAKGRLVVGMIPLRKRKGLLTMVRLLKKADPEKFFFVFAGNYKLNTYSPSEKEEIEEILFRNNPENSYIELDYIQEGAPFNAVFNAIDVPFLVYKNFLSSSNLITKSAIFKKKVLTSNQYCIGEDVKKYRLGKVVNEGDDQECLKAIEEIYAENGQTNWEGHEYYAWLHSESILKDRFQELLKDLEFQT